jgi:hypothetical protein
MFLRIQILIEFELIYTKILGLITRQFKQNISIDWEQVHGKVGY